MLLSPPLMGSGLFSSRLLCPFFSLLIFSLSSAQELSFQKDSVSIEMLPQEETLALEFPFSNNSSKAITVRKITAGCNGCLRAELKHKKTTYQPGEKGILLATYSSPSTSGQVDKAISLWYNDNLSGKPDKSLITKINVLPLLSLSKRRLQWKLNGPKQSQQIELRTHDGQPLPAAKIQLEPEDSAKITLKQQNESGTYHISITPHSTKKPFIQAVKLSTGLTTKRNRSVSFYITCR